MFKYGFIILEEFYVFFDSFLAGGKSIYIFAPALRQIVD
jgi:hypothetical protein